MIVLDWLKRLFVKKTPLETAEEELDKQIRD